jgi:hypothetical protein
MTYGAGTTPGFLSLVEETTYHTGAALQPGRWMVNLIPLRKPLDLTTCTSCITYGSGAHPSLVSLRGLSTFRTRGENIVPKVSGRAFPSSQNRNGV